MSEDPITTRPFRAGRATSIRRAAGWLTLLGVVLLALNLRAAIAGLAPLLPDVRSDLALSGAMAGFLTSLPVLCFGLLSPLAALLGRWVGIERALLLAMVGIVAGSLVRTVPGAGWMVAGTAAIGAAITVGNVLVPSVVKQDFPERQGVVTGVTTAALTSGAAAAAAVATPLADSGLGWRGALLGLGAFAAVAAVVWLPQARDRHVAPVPRLGTTVLRSPVTWQLAAFMAMQSMTYYAMLAWLPTLLRDSGVSAAGAGWALGLFNLLGIVTALVVPALATRRRDQRGLALLVCATWSISLMGLLFVVPLYPLWSALGGLAQGGGIALALTLLVVRAQTAESTRELSGTVQSVGYLVASAGPVIVGALRDASGGWTLPLYALAGAIAVMALAGLGAARDRQV